MNKSLTLKEFIELTKDMPPETHISYHSYYKGCCLTPYNPEDPGEFYIDKEHNVIVLNPGSDYDDRKA